MAKNFPCPFCTRSTEYNDGYTAGYNDAGTKEEELNKIIEAYEVQKDRLEDLVQLIENKTHFGESTFDAIVRIVHTQKDTIDKWH